MIIYHSVFATDGLCAIVRYGAGCGHQVAVVRPTATQVVLRSQAHVSIANRALGDRATVPLPIFWILCRVARTHTADRNGFLGIKSDRRGHVGARS